LEHPLLTILKSLFLYRPGLESRGFTLMGGKEKGREKETLPHLQRENEPESSPRTGVGQLRDRTGGKGEQKGRQNQPDKDEEIPAGLNQPGRSPAPERKLRRTRQPKPPCPLEGKEPHRTPTAVTKEGRTAEAHRILQLPVDQQMVAPSLEVNREVVKRKFGLPENGTLVMHDFESAGVRGFLLFFDGLADRHIINRDILRSLLQLGPSEPVSAEEITEEIIRASHAETYDKFLPVVDKVCSGSTAVFVDGLPRAVVVETTGWERRRVDKPVAEMVLQGPMEGFTETLQVNLALVRKGLRTPQLVAEMRTIGRRTRVGCAIVYLRHLTNSRLVDEVRRRVGSIDTDLIIGSCTLARYIEDHPYGLFPQVLNTERPDRVISFLLEGKVAVLVDGSPFALVVPTTFFQQIHTAEDSYVHWPYGSMLRLVRVAALFISFLLPALYIASVTFHQGMIPTDLLLSIKAARERVPFPSVMEVLLMEGSFEFIREAGIRIPSPIGPTLGIVGALILGQSAVAAGIVSPFLIIIVALTGIASFAIPSYSLSLAFRLLRFLYIALAGVFGFYGIALGLFVQLTTTTYMKSFGTPYMAPLGPRTFPSQDVILRGPAFQQERRPDTTESRDILRQPHIARGWTVGHGAGKAKRADESKEPPQAGSTGDHAP